MACLRCDDKIAIVNCVPFSPSLPYLTTHAGLHSLHMLDRNDGGVSLRGIYDFDTKSPPLTKKTTDDCSYNSSTGTVCNVVRIRSVGRVTQGTTNNERSITTQLPAQHVFTVLLHMRNYIHA